MSANSEIVFRILGIPSDATIANLGEVLAEQFSAEGIALNTRKTTICPSCYSDGTQTALVQFMPNPPVALLALTNGGGYDIEFGDSGKAIYADRDFYGLTPLYGAAGPIEADIVAVCGLNGHAYGSWRGRNNLPSMWLRHYLSQDFPNCRAMTYGYNSRLTASAIHTTRDFTTSFLEELNKARPSDAEKTRPIIFIGHSFGGIIIAQALVKAKENDQAHGTLFESVCATIFFGTPHRGILVDDILAMVGEDSPRSDLVNSIALGSDALKTELVKFIHCSSSMRIVSFYETTQTRKLAKGSDGRWSRSGEYFTFVDQSSSVLYPRGNELNLPAEGDHSSMVKFGYKEHSSYTSVIKFLRDLSFGAAATPHTENTALTPYQAVITGDVNALARIFQSPVISVDVNKKCALGTTTLLHVAVAKRDKKMIALLLESGADIKIKNAKGATVLHGAVVTGDEAVVELLLQNGAQIEAKGCEGITALHLPAAGDGRMVSLLLKNRADITAVNEMKYTALIIAACVGSSEAVELLLEHGANPKLCHKTGATALHLCTTRAMVEALLKYGADIEQKWPERGTALHSACQWDHQEVAAALLDHGADIRAVAPGGFTTLHMCTTRGMIELLLNHGADIEMRSDNGSTPLHAACSSGLPETIAALVDNGADIEAEFVAGITSLHFAAGLGHEAVVKALLEKGANVMAISEFTPFPLHCAAESGHEVVVAMLLDGGAEIEAKDMSGLTALHHAAQGGHEKVVEMLVQKGANVMATSGSGAPLHLAANNGHEKVVEVLLSRRADIDARNPNGPTALHIATARGHEKVVKVLLRNGANIMSTITLDRAPLHRGTGLDIGALESGDMVPLHVAALLGYTKVLEVLLMYHPDTEAKAEGGRTALIIAARNGDVETVGILLRGGASVAADNMRTRTALHPATIHGHAEVVAILLEHGADRRSYGMVTALRTAKKAGYQRVVELLTL